MAAVLSNGTFQQTVVSQLNQRSITTLICHIHGRLCVSIWMSNGVCTNYRMLSIHYHSFLRMLLRIGFVAKKLWNLKRTQQLKWQSQIRAKLANLRKFIICFFGILIVLYDGFNGTFNQKFCIREHGYVCDIIQMKVSANNTK